MSNAPGIKRVAILFAGGPAPAANAVISAAAASFLRNDSEAIGIKHPFYAKDGRVCIFLSEFRSWLAFHRDERLGRKQLATLLRTAHSEPVTINYIREADQMKTTCACWTVPLSIVATLPQRVARATVEEPDDVVPF